MYSLHELSYSSCNNWSSCYKCYKNYYSEKAYRISIKTLATESLITRVTDYNLTKLIKKDSTKEFAVGTIYPRKSSSFNILRRLVPFNQAFRQVIECLILGFHELIRMSHRIACPMVFILLSGRGSQGEMLNKCNLNITLI